DRRPGPARHPEQGVPSGHPSARLLPRALRLPAWAVPRLRGGGGPVAGAALLPPDVRRRRRAGLLGARGAARAAIIAAVEQGRRRRRQFWAERGPRRPVARLPHRRRRARLLAIANLVSAIALPVLLWHGVV